MIINIGISTGSNMEMDMGMGTSMQPTAWPADQDVETRRGAWGIGKMDLNSMQDWTDDKTPLRKSTVVPPARYGPNPSTDLQAM